jgi:hypothetical protein
MRTMLAIVLTCCTVIAEARSALAGNFSTGAAAVKFGVHEVLLTGDGSAANPFDTLVTVTFTPSSGANQSRTVPAFYDGENTWRARVYVSESGSWRWESRCAMNARLDAKSGTFEAIDSKLRGRLLPHPKNPRQWITEDGRWFLNLNDTAYFLLCLHDGNGDPITDEDVRKYVRDDVERGITSVRCFAASRRGGFSESSEQWKGWYFEENTLDRLRLENLQCADHRLRILLDEFPDVTVQLIMFPLEGYARDDKFWTALAPDQRDRLLRHFVARFAAYPQVFWLITNDAHYGDNFPNSNAMARQVGAYLQRHDPWQHPRSTGHARRLPFYFGGEDWVTYVHIEHAHDLGALQYRPYRDLAKPVFLGEDRYEQDHAARQDPLHMRYWQRRLFWAWLLSGGSTNYGGRWWTVHPYSETGSRPGTYQKRTEAPFRAPLAGLDSVRPIRDFFENRSIDLGEFEPDHALAQVATAKSDAQTPRLMRRGRQEFLIYHPHAGADEQAAQVNTAAAAQLRLDLRACEGRFSVEWYRAEDGQSQRGDEVVAGDWCELTAPWPGADVIVRLLKR